MPCVCPSWFSFILYNPIRKIFTDRQAVLDECNITSESVVLEVGAGNGFFTESIAERAKKVIAVELQQGMVRKLRKRTARFGEKMAIITGDIADCGIQDAIADVCLLYYSFHEIERKDEAARVIGNALKPGGSLAIFEPTIEVSGEDMQAALAYFMQRGFILEKTGRSVFTRYARLSKPMIQDRNHK